MTGNTLEGLVGQCRSYRDGSVCANGFVQKPYCRGVVGCYACGHIRDSALPMCLRDDIPEHMSRQDGSPLFYQAPNAAVERREASASNRLLCSDTLKGN